MIRSKMDSFCDKNTYARRRLARSVLHSGAQRLEQGM